MVSERSWVDVWEKAQLGHRKGQAEQRGWAVGRDCLGPNGDREEYERDGEASGLVQALGCRLGPSLAWRREEKGERILSLIHI